MRMANPFFNRFGGRAQNPMVNVFQMAAKFKQIQNDPSQIPKMLLDSNKISQQQYEEMKKFGGNPKMMGEYLLQSGTMTQQNLSEIQKMVPDAQTLLK